MASEIDPLLLFAADARDLKRLIGNATPLPDRIPAHAIFSTVITLRRAALDILSQHNISFTQARILLELRRCAHPFSITALAKQLGLSNPIVAERCAELNARNLISRNEQLAGRGLHIMLSPAGKRLANRLAAWSETLAAHTDNLSATV